MKVIIRDDDISYFTQPSMLEEIYSKCWDCGIPICFSVIPSHSTDTQGSGLEYEPNIPPAYRCKKAEYAVSENKKLCNFLNKKNQ
jgi:hypothetical protein